MDGDPNGTSAQAEQTAAADGGTVAGMGEAELYTVVREAVEDAILSAAGSILLAGLALSFAWAGVTVVLGSSGVTGATGGTVLVVAGVFLAARVLNLVPPISEWGE